VGPEHSYLYETGRVRYVNVSDRKAVEGFMLLSETEGIIPALESAHAIAYAREVVPKMKKGEIVIINVSGRGDKDVEIIKKFIKNRV
jgi:tryptophan synthase beta chain